MNKITKNDIKVLIFLLLIFAVIAIVTVVLSINNNKKQNNVANNVIGLSNMDLVNDYNTFFFVGTNVDNYLSIIELQEADKIINILDKTYIDNNNIIVNNVLNNFSNYGKEVYYKAKYVFLKNFGNNYVYYTNGSIIATKYEKDVVLDDNFNLMLYVDYTNLTIAFRPVLDEKEAEEIIFNTSKFNIPKNDNNSFVSNQVNVTTETICSLYLSDFISKLNYNVTESYDILFDEIKNKYVSISEYEQYIAENINKFSYAIDKCGIINSDNRIYQVYDKNGNFYKFSEKSIMNYSVYFELNEE